MSISFVQDGTEKLKLQPILFRRVYTLETEEFESTPFLKYSHTDVVVKLENESTAMIEICQGALGNGTYSVTSQPTGLTVDVHLTKSGTSCMNWLKKIVFMSFPNIITKDIYCNTEIRPYESISTAA